MSYARISILKRPGEFDRPLTYRVPRAMLPHCRVGQGVLVPLRDKPVRGIVISLESTLKESLTQVFEVQEFLPELGLTPEMVTLATCLADYYQCSLLRVLKLFVPAAIWKGVGKRTLAKIEQAGYSRAKPEIFPLQPLTLTLTDAQKEALTQMDQEARPVLLHGVTGSGKTELYLRLILKTIKQGKQAALLLPEIALTPQMIAYFERYFGPHIALFHSKLSEGQKLHEWFKVKTGYAPLVIGSRSAIFAPLTDLGVLILDEEHEWTYKQESSPYYETHRVAEMLKEMTGCTLVFGSATPRLETLHRARVGQYAYIQLSERVNATAMPVIEVVDLREEFKKKNFSIFSESLFSKIQDRLDKKQQIILFVNQRGMARAVVCRDCGLAVSCPHCEVSLKLHGGSYGSQAYLLCHYCAYRTQPSISCSYCHSVNIRHAGLGTERVEEAILQSFPQARVIRADKDTTSDKLGFEPIYDAFKKREYDILVGTQMVAKGLDFPDVTLIGIMLADIGLHIPDFRSHERLFQLITQVSGRAGRGISKGEVVLQTYQPEHHAIRLAASYSYDEFATQELAFRARLKYPPYSRMIKFIVTGTDEQALRRHMELEMEVLEDIFRLHELTVTAVMAPAMIPKIGLNYYFHLLLKGDDPERVFKHWTTPKGWRVDIDPVHAT